MKTGEWEKVGRVYVDGGYIVVGDPWNLPKDGKWFERIAPLDNENGEIEDGIVAVKTGLGDGCYNVEVRYEDVPGWGRRVAEMRIVFLTDEMLDIGKKLMGTIDA